MTRHLRSLQLAATILAGALTVPAFAQGTAEQREACTPDAIKLCSDAIPDVGKTTACMKRHEAQLSSRCHAAFLGSTGRAGRSRVAKAAPGAATPAPAPDDDDSVVAAPDDNTPDVAVDPRSSAREAREARRVIAGLCRSETLDPSTCRVAGFALDIAR